MGVRAFRGVDSFRALDKNHDGALTFDEYLSTMFPLANPQDLKVMMSWTVPKKVSYDSSYQDYYTTFCHGWSIPHYIDINELTIWWDYYWRIRTVSMIVIKPIHDQVHTMTLVS